MFSVGVLIPIALGYFDLPSLSIKYVTMQIPQKRRPGRNIAIYIGVVTAVLIMSYNLSKAGFWEQIRFFMAIDCGFSHFNSCLPLKLLKNLFQDITFIFICNKIRKFR